MPVDPGLQLDVLRRLHRPRVDLGLIRQRIHDHLRDHDGYVAFSGGKDSLVVLDLARQIDPAVPVVFFDSGLEYPQTYHYLDHLHTRWRLNLHVIPTQPGLLDLLVIEGNWDHDAPAGSGRRDLHQVLIARPAAAAHSIHGPGELWGVRAHESAGRRIAYARALAETCCSCTPACQPARWRARHGGVITRADQSVAYGPIWDWTTACVWAHIANHDLPVNPAYDILRRIGAPEEFLRISHLIDTARLDQGRLTWLRRGWPTLFDELATVLPRIREYV